MWGVAIFSKMVSFGKFAQKPVWSAESENTSASYILPNWITFLFMLHSLWFIYWISDQMFMHFLHRYAIYTTV
jgi:hypothetical protein